MAKTLSLSAAVLVIESPATKTDNWEMQAKQFQALLQGRGFRQASLVGFAAAAVLTQHLALTLPKFVRTLVLVDATTRACPSLVERIAARLERWLPLGLPLRSQAKGFDSSPYLQRVRVPCLVVTSPQSSPYQRREAERLSLRLPTSWQASLKKGHEAEQLGKLLAQLQDVPARCPQGV